MPTLATILIAGFSLAVATAWLRYHVFATGDHWLWIGFPLIVYGVLASGSIFLLSRSKKPFQISPLSFLVALIATSLVIFDAQVFLRPAFLTGMPLSPGLDFIAANISFGKFLLAILALYGTLSLVLILTGNYLLRISTVLGRLPTDRPGILFALRFITGLGAWTGFLIFFHWLGLLNARSIIFTILALSFIERRRLIEIGKWCLKKIPGTTLSDSFAIFLATILLFLVVFNIAETIRPMPIGYDDMTHYMNRVALMTERQSLLDGASRYNFELLAAGIGIAIGESSQSMLSLSFGAYGLLIGTLFVFLFARELISARAGLIAASLFLSIPMGPALAILETKPDSLLLPIAIAIAWLLAEADRTKNRIFAYFACFSFGLAIGTKLTGAIFAPGIVLGCLFVAWRSQLSWTETLRAAFFSCVFFALGLGPWFLHGQLNQAKVYLHPHTETTFSEDLSQELWGGGQKCSFLGQTEDMLRFDPEPGWNLREIVTAPWHMTMNRYVSLFATEFGFLFLAILPFGFLAFFRKDSRESMRKSGSLAIIFVTLTGATLLWGMYAEHIVWYLFPLLPLGTLLIAWIFEKLCTNQSLRWLLMLLIIASLIGNSLVRMKFGSSEPRLRYSAGAISTPQYTEAVFPGYGASMEILNLDPESRILVTGSRHWYGIRDNDRRAHMDTHLEAFSCLLNRYGADGTLATLQRLDVRYILFSKSLLSEYESTSRPTFTKKIREFVEFSQTHLQIVWGSSSHMIYQIPGSADR